jgi:hypothetical protein
MGELLRQGKKVMHATGSSAFTNTLRKIVGARAKNLFKNFFSTVLRISQNYVDVLFVMKRTEFVKLAKTDILLRLRERRLLK